MDQFAKDSWQAEFLENGKIHLTEEVVEPLVKWLTDKSDAVSEQGLLRSYGASAHRVPWSPGKLRTSDEQAE